jgi:hypothetical protein
MQCGISAELGGYVQCGFLGVCVGWGKAVVRGNQEKIKPRFMLMKRILIAISALLIYSCKSDQHTSEKATSSFDCPYQKIEISETNEQHNDGSKLSGGIKINLESNTELLKKIGKGEINIEFSDTTVLNNITKQISKKTLYSANFMETHNSIIQILCSIEKDLQDTTLSNISRDALLIEKIKKRTDYFNFLLSSRDSITSEKKNTPRINKRTENISESKGQKSGITANKINVGDDEKSSITINRVTSTNQQGGITANEVHIYEKEKEPELTKENLDLLFQEALNLKLPPNYPTDGNVHIPTILHGETLSEFKMYEKKGWLTIKSNGNLTNMGANNRIGDSIEDKKRPWGMGNGYIITLNKTIYKN